jgi:hypothetical protein
MSFLSPNTSRLLMEMELLSCHYHNHKYCRQPLLEDEFWALALPPFLLMCFT